MRRYVLLAYGDEQQLDTLSHSERDTLASACLANDAALWNSGHLLAMEELQSSRNAITVRVQPGQLSVRAGPYAETTEQLIGIFTIIARDLNEAIQVAARLPQAQGGPIEVRPLVAFEQPYPHQD
jgi:hypothetical protein